MVNNNQCNVLAKAELRYNYVIIIIFVHDSLYLFGPHAPAPDYFVFCSALSPVSLGPCAATVSTITNVLFSNNEY